MFQGVERLAVKPVSGSMGSGFRVIDIRDDLPAVYDELSADPGIIAEEFIFQTGLLHDLNPSSLNTIRVITLRMPEGVRAVSSYLRLGGPQSMTDNLHTGGVKVVIRMSDGKLLDGMTMTRNRLTSHPVTGVPFSGLTVPRWDEVVDFCVRAHEAAPEGLDRIGWDVCVDETHLLMIEGNAIPGFAPPRRGNPDCWKMFRQYLDAKERAGQI